MKSTIRKKPDSAMRKNTHTTSSVYTTDFWRECLAEKISKLDGESFIGALIKGDPYYDSHQGTKDYKNLTMNRASLLKTQRACDALDKYYSKKNKQKSSAEQVIKRSKIEI